MKDCLQWRHWRGNLLKATPRFLSFSASIPVDWHMVSESADFLLKASVDPEADVEGGYVGDPCGGPGVAEFGRSAFSLVENGGDLGAMRRGIGFHFRVCGGAMSWLFVGLAMKW